MIYNLALNNYVCRSCTVYILLFTIFLIIIISRTFIYFYWYLKKSNTCIVNINPSTETVIYETYEWEISNKLILKFEHVNFLMT